jgi:excisionase family DNA binding protein
VIAVIDALAEGILKAHLERYIKSVFLDLIAPSDYNTRLRLAEELLRKYGPLLYPGEQLLHPAFLAVNLEQFIKVSSTTSTAYDENGGTKTMTHTAPATNPGRPAVNASGVPTMIALNGIELAALPPVLTLNEVAVFLRCSRAHVCHLIQGTVHGTAPLPAVKLGRHTLIRKESLASWLACVES